MTRKYSHLAACPTYTLLVPAPESGYILNGLTALPPVTLCMARYALPPFPLRVANAGVTLHILHDSLDGLGRSFPGLAGGHGVLRLRWLVGCQTEDRLEFGESSTRLLVRVHAVIAGAGGLELVEERQSNIAHVLQ